MKSYNKSVFIKQGLILTSVSLFLRITGIFFRSYLSAKLGSETLGEYMLIFSLFTFSVTLSTSGISLAVTQLVSKDIIEEQGKNISKIIRGCFGFCLILSILVAAFLFIFSDFMAERFLGDVNLSLCLKTLSFGLPFMSLCTTMKGYFLAIEKGTVSGIADTLEQFFTIALTIIFFLIFPIENPHTGLFMAMIASSIGEIISFTYNFVSYKRSLRIFKKAQSNIIRGTIRNGLFHIALPCTLSSAIRSMLSTLENILIPIKLESMGLLKETAHSSYGIMQGMAMPVIYFPASFLSSFAFLMIPKITFDRENKSFRHLAYLSEKALSTSLAFGVFFAAFFFVCFDEISLVFYKSYEAGVYIKWICPLVPFMYLDIVVDNLLKGMDKQFDSMKFNLADAFLRVLFIILFMGKFGMKAYVAIIWFSTLFNAYLSLNKLIKVTDVKIKAFSPILFLLPISILLFKLSDSLFSLINLPLNFLLIFKFILPFIFYFYLCYKTLYKTKRAHLIN